MTFGWGRANRGINLSYVSCSFFLSAITTFKPCHWLDKQAEESPFYGGLTNLCVRNFSWKLKMKMPAPYIERKVNRALIKPSDSDWKKIQ